MLIEIRLKRDWFIFLRIMFTTVLQSMPVEKSTWMML